jgi:hypothetical protein
VSHYCNAIFICTYLTQLALSLTTQDILLRLWFFYAVLKRRSLHNLNHETKPIALNIDHGKHWTRHQLYKYLNRPDVRDLLPLDANMMELMQETVTLLEKVEHHPGPIVASQATNLENWLTKIREQLLMQLRENIFRTPLRLTCNNLGKFNKDC